MKTLEEIATMLYQTEQAVIHLPMKQKKKRKLYLNQIQVLKWVLTDTVQPRVGGEGSGAVTKEQEEG